jgi:hypothetical protein
MFPNVDVGCHLTDVIDIALQSCSCSEHHRVKTVGLGLLLKEVCAVNLGLPLVAICIVIETADVVKRFVLLLLFLLGHRSVVELSRILSYLFFLNFIFFT